MTALTFFLEAVIPISFYLAARNAPEVALGYENPDPLGR
jgi:hypothetical protein